MHNNYYHMKKNFTFASALAIAILMTVGTSCSNTTNEEPTETRSINISARTAEENADIDWPLKFYAFKSDTKNMVSSTTINDAEADAKLQLNRGKYTLVALAGTDNLDIPESPTLDASIGVPENGIFTTPPQMTTETIEVESDNIATTMTLSYPVAKIALTLNDMPTATTTASATLTNLYGAIAFDGTMTAKASPTLELNNQGNGTWTSGTAYVMPSDGNLALTITTNDGSYTITTSSELEAGKSYQLKGAYKDEITVTVTFGFQGWTDDNDIDFDIKD